MNVIKLVVMLGIIFGFSPAAYADEDYSGTKDRMTKRVDKRISALTEYKACIEKSDSMKDLEMCRSEFKAKKVGKGSEKK